MEPPGEDFFKPLKMKQSIINSQVNNSTNHKPTPGPHSRVINNTGACALYFHTWPGLIETNVSTLENYLGHSKQKLLDFSQGQSSRSKEGAEICILQNVPWITQVLQ